MGKNAWFLAIFITLSAFFGAGVAHADKVNVDNYRWWAIVEKLELSLNKGSTFVTIFEGYVDETEMTDDTSLATFVKEDIEIPAGVYNYFRLTMTVTRWKVLYNDAKSGAAYIAPEIDDREIYEIEGPTLISLRRNDEAIIYIQFDRYKSLRDCEAHWNGVNYTLDSWSYYPEVKVSE